MALLKAGEKIGGKIVSKIVKKEDPLALPKGSNPTGNYTQSMKTQATGTQLLEKYPVQPSAQMKAYQSEVADVRAGKAATTTPVKQHQVTVTPESKQKLTSETVTPGAQKLTKTTTKSGAGKTLAKTAAAAVGIPALATAGIVGIPALLSNLSGNGEDQDNQDPYNPDPRGGKEKQWWDGGGSLPYNPGDGDGSTHYILYPDGTVYDPYTGETAYIGGDGWGDEGSGAGSTSIFTQAADAISQNLPYILIGVGVLILILALSRSKGKPSAKKKTAKKGGSRA